MPAEETIIRPMTYSQVLQEARQGPRTRLPLYEKLQKDFEEKYVIVSFFMAFGSPGVFLNNSDADMLEEVLHNTNLDGKSLLLVLNCPGGDALTAERIITICRTFSPNGYSVVVPKQAKSAATMICLGASRLYMSATSELGPIDPQIFDSDGAWAAHEIIESYEDLIRKATKAKGNLDPYLQQLHRFDARNIRWIRSAQQLSESIALKALGTGALKGKSPKAIRKKIGPFLNPKYTKSHGRPIYHDVATKCGLDVELLPVRGSKWRTVWELYVRLGYAVNNGRGSKIIESQEDHYIVPYPASSKRERE